MAYAYINSVLKQGTSSGTGNSAATNMTGADLLTIVQCINLSTLFSNPPTDSLGNTYTLAVEQERSGPSPPTTGIWYSQSPTVSSSMTFASNSGNFDAIAVAGYSGSAATPLDAINKAASGSATSLSTGSVTITAGELVVFGLGDGFPATITATPGTVRQQAPIIGGNSFTVGIGDIIGGSAGSQSSTWSTSGSAAQIEAVIASFKGSGGGGATRPVKMVGRWGGYAGASGGFAA